MSASSRVVTALGPVDGGSLGPTLMHEHLFVLTPEMQQNYPEEWGSEEWRVDEAVLRLQEAYEAGIRTLVDLTVVGLGRFIPRIRAVAERVRMNIVVATGLYTYRDLPFYFRHRRSLSVDGARGIDPMVELFLEDIQTGIAGTGVKAGMLKCAIDEPGLTPDVERVMRAVAQAHRVTGTPITVHTDPASRSGLEVHRVMCEQEGVDPGCIVLGHSGDSTDLDHLIQLADLGFVLGMDRFGLGPSDVRARTVATLCGRGYAEQLVLSHDAACYLDWFEPAALAQAPQWNYSHIPRDVLPLLREQGVTSDQLDAMLVRVPRTVLASQRL